MMRIKTFFIISAIILSFLPVASAYGQNKTRAEKKKEKNELLDKGYFLMKEIVHSGEYRFTADRMSAYMDYDGGGFKRSESNLYSAPNNYVYIKNGEISAWLTGLPGRAANSLTTGKIADLKVIEKDKSRKIIVEVTIENSLNFHSTFGNQKMVFTIMPNGEAMLIVKGGDGALLASYFGKIELNFNN